MQVVITGKQLNLEEALLGHVENKLADATSNYLEQTIEPSVVFSGQGKGKRMRSDISVYAGRIIRLQGHAEFHKAKAAFDAALKRKAIRLRCHKRRLRDHQKVGQEI